MGVVMSDSSRFSKIRKANKSELAEDYLERIEELQEEKGEARIVDLAKYFGVRQATVNNTVQRLARDGYLIKEPYAPLFLTKKGKELAEESRKRHEIVLEFLLSLGISKETAQLDAEGIEHHVSPETLDIFAKFARKARENDS